MLIEPRSEGKSELNIHSIMKGRLEIGVSHWLSFSYLSQHDIWVEWNLLHWEYIFQMLVSLQQAKCL